MANNKENLSQQLTSWLADKHILNETRQILGGSGLSDTKIANWRRAGRELPDTFIEGAALCKSALKIGRGQHDPLPPAISAEKSWQVFVVDPETSCEATPDESSRRPVNGNAMKDSVDNLDCHVFRLWTGVASSVRTDTDFENYLTHKTWFSGNRIDENLPMSLTDAELELGVVSSNEVRIGFPLTDDSPRDIGYSIKLSATFMAPAIDEQSREYLGGITTIPVRSIVLIGIVPVSVLKRSTVPFAQQYVPPTCVSFLSDGSPIRFIEDILRGKLDRKWLAPWFQNHGFASSSPRDCPVPVAIKTALNERGFSLSMQGYKTFVFEIQNPEPFLHHSLVFELAAQRAGKSD